MEKIKPCPCCNSSVFCSTGCSSFTPPRQAWVKCDKCGLGITKVGVSDNAAILKATKAWNTRYERTCHAVGKDGKPYEPSKSAGLLDAYCDECWDYLGGRERDHIGEHCRGCGAKVVEQ